MREFLFRGKRLDNGEWVYGNYGFADVYTKHKHYIFQNKAFEHAVDPETVGQYTGLLDENGTKIFEGDIVHFTAHPDEANCLVIFKGGEFRLVPERLFKTYVTGGGYHALRCFEKEVIGNIHDNPELLEA